MFLQSCENMVALERVAKHRIDLGCVLRMIFEEVGLGFVFCCSEGLNLWLVGTVGITVRVNYCTNYCYSYHNMEIVWHRMSYANCWVGNTVCSVLHTTVTTQPFSQNIPTLRWRRRHVLNRGLYCVLGLRTGLCTVLMYCTEIFLWVGIFFIRNLDDGQQWQLDGVIKSGKK